MNIFLGGQCFEDKSFAYTRDQTYMIIFFLGDQDFERPVIPFGGWHFISALEVLKAQLRLGKSSHLPRSRYHKRSLLHHDDVTMA